MTNIDIGNTQNRINQIINKIQNIDMGKSIIKDYLIKSNLDNVRNEINFLQEVFFNLQINFDKELCALLGHIVLYSFDGRNYLDVWETDPYSVSPLICESGFEARYNRFRSSLQQIHFKRDSFDILSRDLAKLEQKIEELLYGLDTTKECDTMRL